MIAVKIVYLCANANRDARWMLLIMDSVHVIGCAYMPTKPTKKYIRQFIKLCK